MPNIFKALASITTWILFLGGCLGVLFALIAWIGTTDITQVAASKPHFLVTAVTPVAGVAVMKLRKGLE